MSGTAIRRLKKELTEAQDSDGCSAKLEGDDIFSWIGIIKGPEDSPYEGGTFYL